MHGLGWTAGRNRCSGHVQRIAEERIESRTPRANPEQHELLRTNGDMPPPQQQRAPRKSCDGWIWIFVYCGIFLFAGFYIAAALSQHGPCFTVATLSVSNGRVAFNVCDSNPNRHYGISYKSGQWASLLFDDGATVASGQANMSTTSITGVLDVIDKPGFSAALRAGRDHLPLRLQLTTPIRLLNVFPSVKRNMRVDCDLIVDAKGSLLCESVGASCDTYF